MQQRRADLRSRVKVYLPRRRYNLLPWVVNGKHLVAHFRDAEHGVTGRRSVIEPIGSSIAGCGGRVVTSPLVARGGRRGARLQGVSAVGPVATDERRAGRGCVRCSKNYPITSCSAPFRTPLVRPPRRERPRPVGPLRPRSPVAGSTTGRSAGRALPARRPPPLRGRGAPATSRTGSTSCRSRSRTR